MKQAEHSIPVISILFILLGLLGCGAGSKKNQPYNKERLRSTYKNLSKTSVKQMLKDRNFFDKYWNKSGGFKNQYESMKINNARVIIDHATGLIWHPSGSMKFMSLPEAKGWINQLNQKKFAGFNDWRLPTLEEALTLLENRKKKGNLYIDPLFDNRQWCIFTGDTLGSDYVWLLAFSGRVDWFDKNVHFNYVRPVRSNLTEE